MTFFLKRILFLRIFVIACSCNETQNSVDTEVPEMVDAMTKDTTDDVDADSTIKTFITREPSNHRVNADACDNSRPNLPISTVLGESSCTAHSDCTEGVNGRCSTYGGIDVSDLYCTYDACFSDNECLPDEVCNCGDDIHADNGLWTDANRCVPSDCKTDADCSTGHWCKATPSPCGDGTIVGYSCTTNEDECRDNTDCAEGTCSFPFFDETYRYVCEQVVCN